MPSLHHSRADTRAYALLSCETRGFKRKQPNPSSIKVSSPLSEKASNSKPTLPLLHRTNQLSLARGGGGANGSEKWHGMDGCTQPLAASSCCCCFVSLHVTLMKCFPFRDTRRDLAFVALHAGINECVFLAAHGGIQFGTIHLLALDTVLTNNFFVFRAMVRGCLCSRSCTLIFRRGGSHSASKSNCWLQVATFVAPHFWNLESRNKRYHIGDFNAPEEFRHHKDCAPNANKPTTSKTFLCFCARTNLNN
jgi:hypothetical protein